ncbi:HET-domain-containing protein [Podospora aff. communis PSN243]|uniref:HET-domain-containing protein n=1 Tax=Podospora aff. communis PSN243 TaxID=3040156 RepID=A0AAV9GSV7_9PEZI|nr:HET-domain-containing protein [Podospora aff. communis PSN243]
MANLCETCRQMSLDDLTSLGGMRYAAIGPSRCQLCALILTALKSCKCQLEWKLEGSDQHARRAPFDKIHNAAVGLWVRPFNLSWPMSWTEEHSSRGAIPLEHKIEGLTVCYGSPGIVETMTAREIHDLEAGRDIVREAVRIRLMKLPVSKPHICGGSLALRATCGSPLQNLLRYQHSAETADPRADYDLIRTWIKNCAEHHESCRNIGRDHDGARPAPSRLICVNGAASDGTVALVEPTGCATGLDSVTGAMNRYVALSYCWGVSQEDSEPTGVASPAIYCTTIQNLAIRRSGFSVLTLPKTIRDAITITRELGMEYLWVDALCILQGSDPQARADWERESMKMHAIYGGAALTIAAASAETAHEGIFDIRCPRPQESGVEIAIRSKRHGIDGAGAFATILSPTHSLDEPLYHRGWTLQERVLSPRVVIYARGQLLWECQSTNLTQYGSPMDSLFALRLPESCSAEDLRSRWQVIVTDYTARDLSRSSDKLTALSGLAQAFQAQMPGNLYLAGLWKDHLLDDLLWCHAPTESARHAKREILAEYRAPSWSWASLDGNVRWYWAYHRRNRLNPSDPVFVAEVISSRTTPKGPDAFGEIVDGAITLRGPLIVKGNVHAKHEPRHLHRVTDEGSVIDYYLDHLALPSDGSSVLCADDEALAKLGGDVYLFALTSQLALVLQRMGMAGASNGEALKYRRLGIANVAYCWDRFHFDQSRTGWETNEVEIV